MKTSVHKAFCRVLPLHVGLQKPHKRKEGTLISANHAISADAKKRAAEFFVGRTYLTNLIDGVNVIRKPYRWEA